MTNTECPSCRAPRTAGPLDTVTVCAQCRAPSMDLGATTVGAAPLMALPRDFPDCYEIGERLGLGAMGVVFRAQDRVHGGTVAIKFLLAVADRAAQERFERECKVLRRLSSPHVVKVLDFGMAGKTPYLVTEYLGGGTLRGRMRAGQGMPAGETVEIARQFLAGLQACHEAGVVHRDFKPENLLFGKDGSLRVADLGVARDYGAERLTQTGAIVGTPMYMSPEQVNGASAGVASDIYSAGLVLYEMLAGVHPFAAPSVVEVFSRIAEGQVRPLGELRPDLPAAVTGAVHLALQRIPGERPRSAHDLAFLLERATSIAPRRAARPAAAGSHGSRLALAVVGSALLAVALTGVRSRPVAPLPEPAREAPRSREPESPPPVARPVAPDSLPLIGFHGGPEWRLLDPQCAAISPEGDEIAIGSALGEVRRFALGDGLVLGGAHAHTGLIAAIDYHDAKTLVHAGDDGKLWACPAQGGPGRVVAEADSPVVACARAAPGEYVVLASSGELFRASVAHGRIAPGGSYPGKNLLALSPDGRTVALAGTKEKGRVLLLDAKALTVRKELKFEGGTDTVSLAFWPDSRRLTASQGSGWTYTLDCESGVSAENTLMGHSQTFSPDGRWVASGSANGSLTVQALPGLNRLTDIPVLPWNWLSGAVSPDGTRLAMISRRFGDGGDHAYAHVYAFHTRDWQPVQHSGHSSPVSALDFSAGLVSGGADGQVFTWPGGVRYPLQWNVRSVLRLPHGRGIVSLNQVNEVIHLEAAGAKPKTISLEWDGKHCVGLELDGEAVSVTDAHGAVFRVDLSTGSSRQHRPAPAPFAGQSCVATGGAGDALVFEAPGGALTVWNARRGAAVALADSERSEGSSEASPDGDPVARLKAQRAGGTALASWLDRAFGEPSPGNARSGTVVFSPDLHRVARGARSGRVQVWDATTGRTLFDVTAHQGRVCALAFSPGGRALGTAGMDGTLAVWDLVTRATPHRFSTAPVGITAVAFSADGRRLAAGLLDGRIAELSTGE